MKNLTEQPNETVASKIVFEITNETVIKTTRFSTGEQFFVYEVTTQHEQYVLRMAQPDKKHKFIAGIAWQDKLIPLDIPLAKFIHADLDGKYSPFPALLMRRLPGNDLCNIYTQLSPNQKKYLAHEMVKIQEKTNKLPDGPGYGILASYETAPEANTWFDFIINRLLHFKKDIQTAGIFDFNLVNQAIDIANTLESDFCLIRPRPFLWDASERNVLVHEGRITGIVDVDDLCFGDPLFVIALTEIALACEGHDTLYTDYWADALNLDEKAKKRLRFYKLFYVVVFMKKHGSDTSNQKVVNFDVGKLIHLFNEYL